MLTLVNLAAAGWIVATFVSRAEWSPQTPAFAVLAAGTFASLAMLAFRWLALPLMRRPVSMVPAPGIRVGVATTFVPGAEEIEMLDRTVRALVAMDYPHETWVLDEGAAPAVRELCERLGARYFTRAGIERYQQPSGAFEARTKHGNYNAWLDAVGYERYELVSSFDPDHVPVPGFLTRVLGYFADPSIGYVQAPQMYYNQSSGLVARAAAEETYAYYSSVQMCSYAAGYPIVTGCHNSHRVSALRAVGGFAAHEADDLAITLAYRVAGWRGVYVPERLAAGLTPTDLRGYLTQQRRWARSVLDIKLRRVPKAARSLPVPERVTSMFHGLYYLHGLAYALGVAVLASMLVTGRVPRVFSLGTAARLAPAGLVLLATDLYRQRFYLDPERERGIHWRAGLVRLLKWPHVFLGVCDALAGPRTGYTITLKTRGPRRRRAASPGHLVTAAVVGAAWVVGLARGVLHSPLLTAVAAAAVAVALGLALMDLMSFPAPYDDDLAQRALSSWP